MIRFRNPTSDIYQLCEIYQHLYNSLSRLEYFTNDDIKAVATNSKLMSSSGFTGAQAAAHGANDDKSRDKTFNNAKMLAEVYRHLGLISVIDDTGSHYNFTFLGEHLLAPGVNLHSFIEQCYMGMVCPNKIIEIKYKDKMRFCLFALNTMNQLSDNCICNKELVIGPMNGNDMNVDELASTVERIENVRKSGNINNVVEAHAKKCTEYKKEGMTITSATNMTRLLNSMFIFTGLASKSKTPKHYRLKGNTVTDFLCLTEYGKKKLEQYNNMKDLRLDEYNKCTSEEKKKALIRIGFYQMLNRVGFDISPLEIQLRNDMELCNEITEGKELLFSPYQTLEFNIVNDALDIKKTSYKSSSKSDGNLNTSTTIQKNKNAICKIKTLKKVTTDSIIKSDDTTKYIEHIKELHNSGKTNKQIIKEVLKEHENEKIEYYNFVVTLFKIMGLNCELGRHGNNSSRMDAVIIDDKRSIPIEIKSPKESEFVNDKAIRQALENKVILLSRKEYTTNIDTPSFAVGHKLPAERSEVPELINAIKETYNIKIAAIGIELLVSNSISVILEDKGIDVEELFNAEGLIS